VVNPLCKGMDLCKFGPRFTRRFAKRVASRFAWEGWGRVACLSHTICLLKPHDLPPELSK
jgi:hypothetical protein